MNKMNSEVNPAEINADVLNKEDKDFLLEIGFSFPPKLIDGEDVFCEQAIALLDKEQFEEAAVLFKRSGSSGSINNYACLVMRRLIKDATSEIAFKLLNIAALLGEGGSILNLSMMYGAGDFVEKDEKKAFALAKESASKGYYPAFKHIAEMYYNGKGVEKNPEKAIVMLMVHDLVEAGKEDGLSKEVLEGIEKSAEITVRVHKVSGEKPEVLH